LFRFPGIWAKYSRRTKLFRFPGHALGCCSLFVGPSFGLEVHKSTASMPSCSSLAESSFCVSWSVSAALSFLQEAWPSIISDLSAICDGRLWRLGLSVASSRSLLKPLPAKSDDKTSVSPGWRKCPTGHVCHWLRCHPHICLIQYQDFGLIWRLIDLKPFGICLITFVGPRAIALSGDGCANGNRSGLAGYYLENQVGIVHSEEHGLSGKMSYWTFVALDSPAICVIGFVCHQDYSHIWRLIDLNPFGI